MATRRCPAITTATAKTTRPSTAAAPGTSIARPPDLRPLRLARPPTFQYQKIIFPRDRRFFRGLGSFSFDLDPLILIQTTFAAKIRFLNSRDNVSASHA